MRLSVLVRPRSARTEVGGEHAGALVVRVREPAVDGRATEATLRALAVALGVRRGALRLVTGAGARHKVIDVEGDAAVLGPRLAALRAGPGT